MPHRDAACPPHCWEGHPRLLLTTCPILSLPLQEPSRASTVAVSHPSGAALGDSQGGLGGDVAALQQVWFRGLEGSTHRGGYVHCIFAYTHGLPCTPFLVGCLLCKMPTAKLCTFTQWEVWKDHPKKAALHYQAWRGGR